MNFRIENAIGRSNSKKSYKRSLSILSVNNLNLAKSSSFLNEEELKKPEDQLDSSLVIKRKCFPQTHSNWANQSSISFTPSSVPKSKSVSNVTNSNADYFDVSSAMTIFNSLLYATCRDALNDDDFQSIFKSMLIFTNWLKFYFF